MRRLSLVALIALVATAGLCAGGTPATANTRARRTPLSIALAHAYQLWGVKPCGGHYRVEIVFLPEFVYGESTWISPGGVGSYADPPAWTECIMRLQRSEWTRESLEIDWAATCTSVLHEWGHLTGHPHSDEAGQPPEPPGTTAEQRAVMRSGAGDYSADGRCGTDPYEHRR